MTSRHVSGLKTNPYYALKEPTIQQAHGRVKSIDKQIVASLHTDQRSCVE